MNLNEIYKTGKETLEKAGIEDFAFDNMCIFEHCFGLKRHELSVNRLNTVAKEEQDRFFSCINNRKNGEPLQYILGEWTFMGRPFKVGEGVLIPRCDTELLVEESLKCIEDKPGAVVVDLCSGSGAVAVSLAAKRTDITVTAVEISDSALKYLTENIKINGTCNISIKKADVLNDYGLFAYESVDLIVANPPYIATGDLANLQTELSYEPTLALNGGTDGLDFYRKIATDWRHILKRSGTVCVEIGYNQSDSVVDIFKNAGFAGVYIEKDINGVNRVIVAHICNQKGDFLKP